MVTELGRKTAQPKALILINRKALYCPDSLLYLYSYDKVHVEAEPPDIPLLISNERPSLLSLSQIPAKVSPSLYFSYSLLDLFVMISRGETRETKQHVYLFS